MTPPLCTFEQSKALKALGYNWPCESAFTHWNSPASDGVEGKLNWNKMTYELWGKRLPYTSCPTIADAIRWFRIEKGIHGWVEPEPNMPDWYRACYSKRRQKYDCGSDPDYDVVESQLLDRLIELTAKQD